MRVASTRAAVVLVLLALTGALLAAAPAPAAPAPLPPPEERVPAGRCLSPWGTLFQRQARDKAWAVARPQQPVHSRDVLLALPGGQAEVESNNGAVRLTLWGNLPDLSRSAVLESAVVLHDEPDVDLSFTLRTGRVVLRNTRDKGAARVRLRVREAVWDLTLPEKGDEAALELSGRWPRGVPFSTDPKRQEEPTADLVFLTLAGSTEVKAGRDRYTLHAPPGPNYFHWDSVDGQDPGPHGLGRQPAWTGRDAGRTTEARRAREALDRLQERLRDQPLPIALGSLLHAADEDADKAQTAATRQLVVFSWGACDDLHHLAEALADPRHAGVRSTAVEALRQWIGRAPGEDEDLYTFLIKQEKYSATQAEIVLQLLHSPFDPAQPETYQTLIGYLGSDTLPVRELARWHLERLVPPGRDIAFDAAGPAEEREKAVRKWKELIPEGQLPPKGK